MDITLNPGVMRRVSWKVGAELTEAWFRPQPNSSPEHETPRTLVVLMDRWVLTFRRAATVYNGIVSERATSSSSRT